MTKVLVTGGRDYADSEALWRVLSEIKPTVIIHGGARGADTLAGEWAEWAGVPTIVVEPKWLLGPIAGHLRNLRMLDLKPDLVVACPGEDGTRHCTTNALLRGIPVRRVV
jgi:hypothetical protein